MCSNSGWSNILKKFVHFSLRPFYGTPVVISLLHNALHNDYRGEKMLQFILGKSGSGKTTAALKILGDLRKKGDKKLLMLVPDQNSFETETAFLNLLGAGMSRDVLVFGFNRLCEYVFENSGKLPQNVIDDGVRKIIMSKALDECVDNLSFFSSSKTRKSVLDLMLHSLKEWKKNNISVEMMEAVSENLDNESLKNKLIETSLVLSAYDALLSETYIDPLDNLKRLDLILEDSGFFEDHTIVVDSFSGFTRAQLEVISSLMRRCKDMYVTLNLDVERADRELFATTERTRKQIKRIASKLGVGIKPDIVLGEVLRTENDELKFLEKHALTLNSAVYEQKTDNIETFIASDIYAEADFAASTVARLICDEGYSYNDIAVVARDLSAYNGILEEAFGKYDIPYYLSFPRDIFTQPLARFISSALDFLIFGYDREALLSMLKSGVSGLSQLEISELENYMFVWNIDRSRLKKEFTNNPSGFGAMTENDEAALLRVEKTRQRVIAPLLKLGESSGGTALEITRALYGLLSDFDVEDCVNRLYDKLSGQGLLFEANEQIRIYNLIIEAFDKLVAAVGDNKLTLKKYKEYLDYLISDIKFSDIPRYQDQVEIGSADRIRLLDKKAVILIGAVDGVFPSIPKTSGVFTENERRILIDNDIPLTDTLEQLAAHEKYLAYCALTSPENKLIVSCYTGDMSGGTYLPSVILTELARLFPNRVNRSSYDIDMTKRLYSERQAFDYLAENYLSEAPEVGELKRYFERAEGFSNDLSRIDSALEKAPFKITNRRFSEKLFGTNIRISASQIEKYNLCAFQYFCNYGLRAKERLRAEMDPIQIGTVVHYALEGFLRAHNKSELTALSEGRIRDSIDEIMLAYAEENFGGLADKDNAFLHLFARLKENVVLLVKHLILQLSHSDFVPVDFELGIGGEIPSYTVDLADGGSVSVNGFIDRVDVCLKNEDEYYVRIVDYKTGKKTFNLYEILYGINMQMLIYLRAVACNGERYYGKKLTPAGILYMPASAPIVNADGKDAEKEIGKGLMMNGLILKDETVLKHMDNSGEFIKLSKKNLNGEYSDTLATSSQFDDIFRRIDDAIREMGESLLSGRVEASPIKGVENGCAFCPYDSVCLRSYGDSYRYAEKKNAKEVYDELKGDDTSE